MDLLEVLQGPVNRHPWEISRAESLLRLIKKRPDYRYVDVGSGDQFLAHQLSRTTREPIMAVDLNYLDDSTHGSIRQVRNLDSLDPATADCLLLLDVLEHVDDDRGLLEKGLSILKPGGQWVITVPAHPFLFSEHDRFLKHQRRYSQARFFELFGGLPMRVESFFSFYTLLFVARCFIKFVQRDSAPPKGVGGWNHGRSLTRGLTAVLNADFAFNEWLSRQKIHLPGLSFCAIGLKTSR